MSLKSNKWSKSKSLLYSASLPCTAHDHQMSKNPLPHNTILKILKSKYCRNHKIQNFFEIKRKVVKYEI